MSDAWDLLVARADLTKTQLVETSAPTCGTGEVVLRVDRVGLTANNVTYAMVGDSMHYWEFFPAESGWGRVPLWGFADVVASDVEEVPVGDRYYGYLPTSSHLVVRPASIDDRGFRDGSEHRAGLPGPYNIYAATTSDPAYVADQQDLQVLFRPLFITSFMLDDFLGDNDFFGAASVVVSSASSKTAYGTAFLIRSRPEPPRLIGLTSPVNLQFTESLGCYDDVVSYDAVDSLATDQPTAYVDTAGSVPLRAAVHEHFGAALVYDAVVGMTHHEDADLGATRVSGPRPTFFFAPDQIRKRRTDWGPGGVEEHFGAAWRRFAPVVDAWVDIVISRGPEELQSVWLEVLAGASPPRAGNVIQL